jgi:glycosyltransferase involved in cell wall biosynthesis
MERKMKASIIITTKNEERNMKNILESLKNQTFQDFEIIVVDNNSTDKTKEISKEYGALVFNKGPERSAQRNFGVSKASGKYVLILDADMILEKNLIKEIYKIAEADKDLKCITMKEVPYGKNFWAQCKKLELEFYTQSIDFELAPRWFDKKVFNDFKGFDEDQTGTEDWDLPERIYKKYPKKYLTKNKVFHNEADYGLFRILKKKFYYASKVTTYVKKRKKSIFDSKFVYFLRPHFYRHYYLWLKNPIVSIGLIFMLTCETFAGGLGYIIGKLNK